nr:immunoglobulin light chain junction region [Macaca mulatta]
CMQGVEFPMYSF